MEYHNRQLLARDCDELYLIVYQLVCGNKKLLFAKLFTQNLKKMIKKRMGMFYKPNNITNFARVRYLLLRDCDEKKIVIFVEI